jgi:polysaccharide pyruvyl transferase WcaK-like protein
MVSKSQVLLWLIDWFCSADISIIFGGHHCQQRTERSTTYGF